MKELELFKKHFGEYKIIKDFKGVKMKVTKRVKLVSVKPAGDGMRYALLTADGEWFSTFDSKVGSYIESVSEGDTVEIEFIENKKGFKNFSSIKLVDDEESQSEEPPPEEPPPPPGKEKRKVGVFENKREYAIMKQSSAKVAAVVLKSLPLDGMDIDGILKVFKSVWNTIFEEFGNEK